MAAMEKMAPVVTGMATGKSERIQNSLKRGQPEKEPVKGREEKRFAVGFLDVDILRKEVHFTNRRPQGRGGRYDSLKLFFVLADLFAEQVFCVEGKINRYRLFDIHGLLAGMEGATRQGLACIRIRLFGSWRHRHESLVPCKREMRKKKQAKNK